jgi:hypothetical protein
MSTSDPTTMPHPNHPDDELLAALAASETDVAANPALAGHVAGCERCTSIVDELRTLRAALAELPDIAPTRPLRFIPPVAPAPAAQPGWMGLLRRVTSPLMGVATVLVLVGALGTAANSGFLGQAASSASQPRDAAAQASGQFGSKELQPVPSISGGLEVPGAVSGGAATPPLSQFNSGGSNPGDAGRMQATPPAGALSVTGSAGNQPPFQWVLGLGVVLLAAAFLVRGALRRRDPPEPA